MSYPTVSLNGQLAHLRRGSTPGFVEVWPGATPPSDWRSDAWNTVRLDRLTVAEAEARWPSEVRALFGGRAGQ